LRHSLS